MEKLTSVTQFNTIRGQITHHPMMTVLDQSQSCMVWSKPYLSELFIIFLKDIRCEDFKYGRTHYDYEGDTLLFISPGQIFGIESVEEKKIQPTGWAIAFHPDFIRGTHLGKTISSYPFFHYHSHEALHVSLLEKEMIVDNMQKIRQELEGRIDKHSRMIVISAIELLLHYCTRFYDRQFITRENLNRDILVRFEHLLYEYFQSEKPQLLGTPTVSYCAEQLHFSANYFGDLIKKETGKTAQEYIKDKIIEISKERILDISQSISEIAYELGFIHPPHFTRLFKQKVGISPVEYRSISV